jgi:hypothetical protein
LFRYRIEHFLLGADAMVVSTIGHRGFLDFTVAFSTTHVLMDSAM